MKHPQAEILIAIANGEEVQYQDSSDQWHGAGSNVSKTWSDSFDKRSSPKKHARALLSFTEVKE